MSRNKLYAFLLPACVAGYAWLGFSGRIIHEQHTFRLCLWHALTGIPCPSCGITRSVVALMDGDVQQALRINPMGFPALLFLLIAPLWMLGDLVLQRQSFYREYRRAEVILRKPPVAVTLALLILANWIWNMSKGL